MFNSFFIRLAAATSRPKADLQLSCDGTPKLRLNVASRLLLDRRMSRKIEKNWKNEK